MRRTALPMPVERWAERSAPVQGVGEAADDGEAASRRGLPVVALFSIQTVTDSQVFTQAVLDYFPWPEGLGFRNTETWWRYVHEQTESDRLNLLMALALLSQEACALLLAGDHALLDRFGFSDETIQFLCAIDVETLTEFSQALEAWHSTDAWRTGE